MRNIRFCGIIRLMFKIKTPNLKSVGRFWQIYFTLKEITRLLLKISPKYLIAVLILNTLWGLSSVPALYLDKLILDRIVANIGNPLWQTALNAIIFLLGVRVLFEIFRNLMSRLSEFFMNTLGRIYTSGLEVLIGNKLSELDIATLENIEFKNRFNKIEQESGRRSWGLMIPFSNVPNYLFGFLGAVGLLILFHPIVAISVIAISLPQFWADSKFIKKEYELRSKFSPLYRLWGWLSYFLVRNLNMMEVKILKLAPFLSGRLSKVHKEIFDEQINVAKSREIYHILVYLPSVILEIIFFVWFIVYTLVQKITVG